MIRLSRTGARKQPHYRVVVIEKERARNGRPVEVVGSYDPRSKAAGSLELKRERIDYWVSKGAQTFGSGEQDHVQACAGRCRSCRLVRCLLRCTAEIPPHLSELISELTQ